MHFGLQGNDPLQEQNSLQQCCTRQRNELDTPQQATSREVPLDLRFYERLLRLTPFLPFSAKAILVAGVATHAPLLALIVFRLAGGAAHVSVGVAFAVALLSTLVGTIGVA